MDSNSDSVGDELKRLREMLIDAVDRRQAEIDHCSPEYRESAANLTQYLCLRSMDLRPLQFELIRLGLSSLGRCESHVLDTIDQIISRIDPKFEFSTRTNLIQPTLGWDAAENKLRQHTKEIFGPKPPNRHVYVMVTAPDAAVVTKQWLDQLLSAGMNILRINTAHGDISEWRTIAQLACQQASIANVPLKIFVDLAGPKIRVTGIPDAPRVQKVRPQRDAWGRVIVPASIALSSAGGIESLGLSDAFCQSIRSGDHIELIDTRSRKRRIGLDYVPNSGWRATCDRTFYFDGSTKLELKRAGTLVASTLCAAPPSRPGRIRLRNGDSITLSEPGVVPNSNLPNIQCSLPHLIQRVQLGAKVMIDDGKLETLVRLHQEGFVELEVVHCAGDSVSVYNESGLNFPGTDLGLAAITEEDIVVFEQIHSFCDSVCLSFVQTESDVRELQKLIAAKSNRKIGIVLKIETRQAIEALSSLLLQAMQTYPVAVMIARGDLAVECGFERLAELQEEIMWLAEAAHIPVIWATQVLESLAKTGIPSRAEVTDAAMSVAAECVMLNKGPYVVDAVECLVDILKKMETHHYKKRAMMRALKIAK
jgi:pyruvate kinase